ncbi:MAG: hypothetical protein NZM00_13185, partial [Anaerolinea sp.]|nr:hypothetical protein [Anaerolinea sp.]
RARRRARTRALIVMLVFLGLVGAGIGALVLRLNAVTQAEIAELRATVAAEIAALRIGDQRAFLQFQRSASEDWIERQRATFNRYRQEFLTNGLQLPGTIRAIDIQDRTARVIVEEISGGRIRQRVWFYWRYEDGWFHVLPDYTFWGEPAVLTGERVTVHYRTLDADFAAALYRAAERWLATICDSFGCEALPGLTVHIVPDEIESAGWTPGQPLTLRSPYADAYQPDAPLDQPVISDLPVRIAEWVVDRALNSPPQYPADAVFLRQAAIAWLRDAMTGAPTTSYLFQDLAARFGAQSIGIIVRGIGPTDDLDAVPPLLGAADLAALNADWRDYLTWRLALERDFIAAGNQAGLLALYDPTNPALAVVAQARLQAGIPEARTVVSARQSIASDGVPQVRTLAQIGDDPARQEEITFRLINSLWVRAS